MTKRQRDLIKGALNGLKSGAEFNLPSLLGKDWPEDAGEARGLGKAFKTAVDNGDFNAKLKPKDPANLRIYEKIRGHA